MKKTKRLLIEQIKQHHFFYGCLAFCISFSLWASFSRLEVVSIATGEVIPQGQVKKIQHLEGGVIKNILIEEGQKVKTGDILFELEPIQTNADLKELHIRMQSLKAQIARLKAEIHNYDEIIFEDNLSTEQIAQEHQFFISRKNHLNAKLEEAGKQIEQRQAEITRIQVRITNQQKKLSLINEQIEISKALVEKDLSSRYMHINHLRERVDLETQIHESHSALEQAKSALSEAKLSKNNITHKFIEQAQKDLTESQNQLAEFNQRIRKYEDNWERTIIRAPVDGIIKALYKVTKGGVVHEGETITEIVPTQSLIIEAHLKPQDIGYIEKNQAAKIKLASADNVRFDSIDGFVTHVSPDTFVNEEGHAFYKIHIKTDTDVFRKNRESYRLRPGVQVVAHILTGQRTVMTYLLSPFIETTKQAFHER